MSLVHLVALWRGNFVLSLLPTTVAGIVGIVLIIADGLIFGLAAKKALTSLILIVIGLLLAGFAGVVIPFITANQVFSQITNLFLSQASRIGPIVYSLPVFWIIGFALGLWKG
jgi:hypothetical protein